MPKIVAKPKTQREINAASMERRGIINKSFKIHKDIDALCKELSELTGKSQAQIFTEAITMYAEKCKNPQ